MEAQTIQVVIDGQPHNVARDGLDGRTVLGLVGADPERSDVLIRIDCGRARLVTPIDRLDDLADTAHFRVHRSGTLRHLKVDGVTWEWGSGVIMESEIREIAGTLDDQALRYAGGDAIRPGAPVDLTTDWVPSILTRSEELVPALVNVVVNGRNVELVVQKVSYDELVDLAFPPGTDLALRDSTSLENRLFTVSYRNGPSDRPEGSLVPTQSLHANQGTVFHVTATDKS